MTGELTPRDANGVPRVSLQDTTSVVQVNPSANGFYMDYAKDGSNIDLTVDGSSTPVEFLISPHSSLDWHIRRFIVWMRDAAIGMGKFGGGDDITNGLLFQIETNGQSLMDWFNAKTNIEILGRATDGEIVSNAFDGGNELLVARWELPFGIDLRTGTSDKIKITVRDDLSNIVLMNVFAEGVLT